MLSGRPWPTSAALLLAPCLTIVLVLGVSRATDLEAQEAGAGPEATLTQVDSIRLMEHPDGVELEIAGSGTLSWSIRDPGNGELIVRLRDCRPGPELAELRPDEGLVESVAAGAFGSDDRPETHVSIRTRQNVKYRVAVGERSVTLLLISREPPAEPSPPVEPPPAELSPADSTVTSPPTTIVTEMPSPEPIVVEVPENPSPEPFAAQAGGYRIGAGDVIAIDVFGLDEMDRRVRVQRDGKISLPLLDVFAVAGLSLEAAELLIAGMLKDRRLVLEPQVTILVEELVSRAVNVQGAVVNPGVYQLIGNKTLLELIGEAGGIREDSGGRILVLRTEHGQERKMDLDLEALVAGRDRASNVPLLPGDVVMVPFSRQLTVYVTGAVEKPGPVTFRSSDGITVLQAIVVAGGPTPRANLKNVHLLRKLPDGGQERIKVNLKKIQSGRVDDLVLERNDTVVVGEWFF